MSDPGPTSELPQIDSGGALSGDSYAFVSYSRTDQGAVRRLALAMRDRGRTLWVDWEGIAPTAEWMAEIREAIDGADAVIFVLSPTSLTSRVCGEELAHAQAGQKKIIPLVVADVEPSDVPSALARLNWLFLRDADDLEELADQLVEVLDRDLAAVKLHTRLTLRSAEWAAAGRDRGRLLRGSDLSEAERWLATPGGGPAPTALQTQYVVGSRQAASRRQRVLVSIVSAALIAALALGGFAFAQRHTAITRQNLARTQALASASLAGLDRDPETSLLLALEATKFGRTALVEEALRKALLASHVERILQPGKPGEGTGRLVFSPDGRTLFCTSNHGGRLDGFSPTGRVVAVDVATGRRRSATNVSIDNFGLLGLGYLSPRRLVTASLAVRFLDPTTGRVTQLPDSSAPSGIAYYNVSTAPDRASLFTASEEGVAREIRASDGALIRKFGGGEGEIYDAQASPDGSTVAVSGVDGLVRLYRRTTGVVRSTLRVGSPVGAVRWSPSGRLLLTTSLDRLARVWDARTGKIIEQMGHSAQLTDGVWIGGDDYIATSDAIGIARVWSVASGDTLSELRGHSAWTSFVVASPDGRHVATASEDGTVRVWRLGPNAPPGRHNTAESVNGVDVTADGRRVVSASYVDGTVLSEARTGRLIRVLDREAVEAPRFSADGSNVATLVIDGPFPAVRLRDVNSGRLLWEQNDFGDRHRLPHAVAFSPDGSRLAVHTRVGVLVLSARDGRVLGSFEGESQNIKVVTFPEVLRKFGHDGDVAWTPDGTELVLPHGRDVVVLDAKTLKVRRRLRGGAGTVLGTAISPDGRMVAATNLSETARIWSLTDGHLIRRLDLKAIGFGVAVSPTGYVATTANDGYLRVWNRAGLEVMRTRIATTAVQPVRFMPDGRRILVGVGEGVNEFVGLQPPTGLRKSGAHFIVDCEVCRPYRQLIRLARTRVTHALPADVRAAALGGS